MHNLFMCAANRCYSFHDRCNISSLQKQSLSKTHRHNSGCGTPGKRAHQQEIVAKKATTSGAKRGSFTSGCLGTIASLHHYATLASAVGNTA